MKSFSATIRMQATEQYFPVLLCVMLYKAFLTFESWMKLYSVTVQKKSLHQYFAVVLVFLYRY